MRKALEDQRQSLRTYLNEHLSQAAAAAALARRSAVAASGPLSTHLAELAKEFNDDRQALLTFMASLDIRVKHLRIFAGWFSGTVGRRPRGRRLNDAALNTLLEIEALRASVQRKISGWEVLSIRLKSRRLEMGRLERLIAKAQRQLVRLSEMHAQTASDLVGGRCERAEPLPSTTALS